MKSVPVKDKHIHPDVSDGDDMVPMVKKGMKKVGMGAHGMKPHMRLDRKSGGWVPKKDFHPGGEKGKLHREMGIAEGTKIPADKLRAATHSDDPEKRRDAIRAETMKKWKKG